MITLSKEMELGVPEVDAQHRELVERINAVTNMGGEAFSKEETEKTLNFLGEYVVKHFADEEALSKRYNYPKHEIHRHQHQFLIDEWGKLMDEFHKNGTSPMFTLQLSNSLITWVVQHIKSADAELGRFIKANS